MKKVFEMTLKKKVEFSLCCARNQSIQAPLEVLRRLYVLSVVDGQTPMERDHTGWCLGHFGVVPELSGGSLKRSHRLGSCPGVVRFLEAEHFLLMTTRGLVARASSRGSRGS